jgi:glycerol uptake facilitator-like aquaporin
MMEKINKIKAEFLGTLILFLVVFSLTLTNIVTISNPYAVPILVGAALAIGIMLFGKISGGNFNPGVSINQISVGNIKDSEKQDYFVGQVLGGLAALLIVLLISSFTNSKLIVPIIPSQFNILTFLQISIYEFVGFSIFLTAIAFANHKQMWKNAIQVGGTLSLVIIGFGFIGHSVHMNLIGELPAIFSISVTQNWNILANLVAVVIGQVTSAIFIARMFSKK